MARKKVRKRNVSLKIGKHKSRKGGLTAAGRKKYNAATGSNLKAPQPGGGPVSYTHLTLPTNVAV